MNLDRRYLTIIITFFIVAGGIIGGIALWQYLTSFHKVTFEVEPSSLTADVYRLDLSIPEDDTGKKVESVQSGKQLTLQEGKYYAIPTDKKYDSEHIAFDVGKNDTAVTINPPFNEQFLSDLLKKELSTIYRVMLTKYPTIATKFTVESPGKLYLDGTWYAAKIVQLNTDPSGQNGDIYSVVLHKVDGIWQFASAPELVLTAPENPSIPRSVLQDLNSQE